MPLPPNIGATQAFYAPQAPFAATPDLAEMARRFAESRKACVITFWVGMFCLWPVWIVTYLEYQKMRNLKEEVARMGVNVEAWQRSFGLRDLI